MLITGALFLAIVLMKYLGQSNSMFVVSFILLLSLGLLITSADFFIEGAKGSPVVQVLRKSSSD